jgi:hypothetical protein
MSMPVTATRVTGKRVIKTQSATWQFPYCSRCAAHAAAWPKAADGCTSVLLGLCTCGIYLIIAAAERKKAEARSRALCGPSCAVPWTAVSYLGWSGTVESFNLDSEVFAFEFMLANSSRLLNVDYGVQARLEHYVAARRAALVGSADRGAASSVPGAVQAAHPDEQLFRRAIEQLERLKGPAARRNALDGALRGLQQQHMRERLLLEASRIEVNAVLDKVDGLKTVDAKRRNLLTAIEQLENDPVPDHLQAQQLGWLRDALRNLDRK